MCLLSPDEENVHLTESPGGSAAAQPAEWLRAAGPASPPNPVLMIAVCKWNFLRPALLHDDRAREHGFVPSRLRQQGRRAGRQRDDSLHLPPV
jgi:hypothetical protein